MKTYIYIFLLILLSLDKVFGQKTSIRYFTEILPDNSIRTIYSFNTPWANDTLVDMKDIKNFMLHNPSEIMRSRDYSYMLDPKPLKKSYKDLRKKITKLKYIEEIILYGDDTDTFDRTKKTDFVFFTKSSKLKVVRLCNIWKSDLFQKYIKEKYKNIIIVSGMAGTSP